MWQWYWQVHCCIAHGMGDVVEVFAADCLKSSSMLDSSHLFACLFDICHDDESDNVLTSGDIICVDLDRSGAQLLNTCPNF